MKILIAYDGSACSDAMVEDLSRAGLPETGEALVLSVVEAKSRSDMHPALSISSGYYFPNDQEMEMLNEDARNEAQAISELPIDRLNTCFPKWRITSEGIKNPAENRRNRPKMAQNGAHIRARFHRRQIPRNLNVESTGITYRQRFANLLRRCSGRTCSRIHLLRMIIHSFFNSPHSQIGLGVVGAVYAAFFIAGQRADRRAAC